MGKPIGSNAGGQCRCGGTLLYADTCEKYDDCSTCCKRHAKMSNLKGSGRLKMKLDSRLRDIWKN